MAAAVIRAFVVLWSSSLVVVTGVLLLTCLIQAGARLVRAHTVDPLAPGRQPAAGGVQSWGPPAPASAVAAVTR